MGKSLQDQLLAKGVARPKQAKKARREKAARDKAAALARLSPRKA